MITGDQFRLAFGQIEGGAVGLGCGGDGVHDKAREAPGREDVPVRQAPCVLILRLDDLGERERAGDHDNGDAR